MNLLKDLKQKLNWKSQKDDKEIPNLTFFEKKSIRYIIKVSTKKLDKFKTLDIALDQETIEKERAKLIDSLVELNDILEITDEKTGNKATEEDFKSMTNEELITLFDDVLTLLDKLV